MGRRHKEKVREDQDTLEGRPADRMMRRSRGRRSGHRELLGKERGLNQKPKGEAEMKDFRERDEVGD